MPITETIKKGQIKRKVSASEVEILRPETEAELVIYDNTDSGLTATDTQAAIDEVAAAVVQAGIVDDVKIQVDAGTATTIVSNKIATIPENFDGSMIQDKENNLMEYLKSKEF